MKAKKAKPKKVTREQELRSLRAWVQRLAKDVTHANEQLHLTRLAAEATLARCERLIGGQRVLLQNFERVLREKDTLVKHVVEGTPLQFDTLPDDFEVVAFRNGSRI